MNSISMQNYYLDSEFIEGPQAKKFLGIKYSETKPTIDLISIAIVAEDGREYYAVSKDFNLNEAWNRYDLKSTTLPMPPIKVYWIRENVLKNIWLDLEYKKFIKSNYKLSYRCKSNSNTINSIVSKLITLKVKGFVKREVYYSFLKRNFSMTKARLRKLIDEFGLPNEVIGKQVKEFCTKNGSPVFYADYCNYDWVVLCWLYGKMIDLPSEFPYYCNDLQQIFNTKIDEYLANSKKKNIETAREEYLRSLKDLASYPRNNMEHNALSDARYDKELHKFLKHV